MSQLRILCIGDIHIKTKNFLDINILLKEIENHLIEMKGKYDLIVSMGDTLDTHKRLDSDCLNKATEYFLMLEKYAPVLLITGNHDLINNSQYLTDKHWLNGFKHTKYRFTVVDTVIDINIKGFRIVALPYVPDGMFDKALKEKLGDDYATNKNKPDLILGHQMFNGVSMGGIDKFLNAEYWTNDIQVITGHIHNRQIIPIEKSQKTVYYTGSSLQHAFGESEDKSIASVLLAKETNKETNTEIKEIFLDLPIRKIVYSDVSEIENNLTKLDLPKILKGLLKIKISVKGDPNEYKAFIKTKLYRDYEKKGIKFDFKGEFKDELYKQLAKYEKNKNNEKKDGSEHKNDCCKGSFQKNIDFFHLFDRNIKDTEDQELLNFHDKMKKKLPIRQIKVKKDRESDDEILIIE